MFHSVYAQFQLKRVQKRLTSREKEISIKEKAIKEKEKELNEVTLKLASAQTYINKVELYMFHSVYAQFQLNDVQVL
jgi:septal ring factor EnvC (AmiA/AmiB activator)